MTFLSSCAPAQIGDERKKTKDPNRINLEMNFRAIASALCAAVKLHANFAETELSPIEALDKPFFLYLAHDSIINHIIERNLAGGIGAASLIQLRFHSVACDVG